MPLNFPPGSGGSNNEAVPPHNLGTISGEVTLDSALAGYQYCNLNNDSVFDISGGSEGAELTFVVQYASGAFSLSFSGIKMPAAALSALPITLEAWKCYIFHFLYTSGGWVLMSADETSESVD
jgi:hypothetical protein